MMPLNSNGMGFLTVAGRFLDKAAEIVAHRQPFISVLVCDSEFVNNNLECVLSRQTSIHKITFNVRPVA